MKFSSSLKFENFLSIRRNFSTCKKCSLRKHVFHCFNFLVFSIQLAQAHRPKDLSMDWMRCWMFCSFQVTTQHTPKNRTHMHTVQCTLSVHLSPRACCNCCVKWKKNPRRKQQQRRRIGCVLRIHVTIHPISLHKYIRASWNACCKMAHSVVGPMRQCIRIYYECVLENVCR